MPRLNVFFSWISDRNEHFSLCRTSECNFFIRKCVKIYENYRDPEQKNMEKQC